MKSKRMSLYIVSVILLVIMILGSLGLATWALLSTKLDVSGNIGFTGSGDVLATVSDGKIDGTKNEGKMNGFEIKANSNETETERATWTNLNDLAFANNSRELVISFSVKNNQPTGGKNLKIDVNVGTVSKNDITIAVTTTEFGTTNPVVIAPQTAVNYNITFTAGDTNTTLSRDFSLNYNLVNTDDPVSVASLYTREGDYIYFGSYAKTRVDVDETQLTSLGNNYYLDAAGVKYFKRTATPAEPYTFSDGTTIVDGTEYYFKVEPIKWKVLSETAGSAMIFAVDILEAQVYDAGSINNYKDSDIRAWLNGTFLATAFTAAEQGIIQTTEVDNSAATTDNSVNEWACENTNDKVFLLSYDDLTNNYGFSADYPEENNTTKVKFLTDYAKSTGTYDNCGAGGWWLRSPYSATGGDSAWYVYDYGNTYEDGSFDYVCDGYVMDTTIGVAPALTIKL